MISNYQDEIVAKGGDGLVHLPRRGLRRGQQPREQRRGGGRQGLLMRIYPAPTSGATAAATAPSPTGSSGLRYAAMRLPTSGGDAHVAIATYTLRGDAGCEALNDRTIVVRDRDRTQGARAAHGDSGCRRDEHRARP